MRSRVTRAGTGILLAPIIATMTAFLPIATAQSPSPTVGETALTPFCAVLTIDEIGEALGFAATIRGGSEFDCAWHGDVNAGIITSLAVGVDERTLADIRPGSPGGVDLSVGADAAYSMTTTMVAYAISDVLWVETGGRLLTLRLGFPDPALGDSQGPLVTLATTTIGRLAGLPTPAASD